jgi:hypothetical protein
MRKTVTGPRATRTPCALRAFRCARGDLALHGVLPSRLALRYRLRIEPVRVPDGHAVAALLVIPEDLTPSPSSSGLFRPMLLGIGRTGLTRKPYGVALDGR